MSNMITIATFTHSHQVYLSKTLLESEKIDVLLKGELMGAIYPGAIGIELQVEEQDAENALRLLTKYEYI